MTMPPVTALSEVVIEAGGAPLGAAAIQTLSEVRVQQRLSLPTLCELAFYDEPDTADFAPGMALRVGISGRSTPIFGGQITAIEYIYAPSGEREVRVRAYDQLHALRKRQTVRTHVQVNARSLARDLVGDLGLRVEAMADGPTWQWLVQHRQSDFDLLVEVAERCGLYLTLRDGVLHLITLEGFGETVTLTLGSTLLEARVEINGDPACRSVVATGWSPVYVDTHEGRARSARSGRLVRAEVEPGQVGGSGARALVNEAAQNQQHAEAMAQAELDARAAREVTLWGVAEGSPLLRPGCPVEVQGLASAVVGRYILTSVNHIINDTLGYVAEIATTPPPARERPRGSVATPGIVTRVNDPEHRGRVRVKLPAYENVETDWLGVVSAGAGQGKGLAILPNVGDLVLVLLTHEDPAQGVVLGGLYGKNRVDDPGEQGGSIRRFTILTPGGQRIRLDDGRGAIRLENRDGSFIELSPGKVRLHADTDLEIEAPGRSITIRGSRIDFERG